MQFMAVTVKRKGRERVGAAEEAEEEGEGTEAEGEVQGTASEPDADANKVVVRGWLYLMPRLIELGYQVRPSAGCLCESVPA